MHRKAKGDIGQAAIIYDLLKKDFRIFVEFGDLSKIDIIAEKENKLYKIQIKSLQTNRTGAVNLQPIKSGPNGYKFRYSDNDVDIFAIHALSTSEIGYVSSKELLKYKNSMSLRLTKPKNNQKNVKYISDYKNIEDAIKDL